MQVEYAAVSTLIFCFGFDVGLDRGPLRFVRRSAPDTARGGSAGAPTAAHPSFLAAGLARTRGRRAPEHRFTVC